MNKKEKYFIDNLDGYDYYTSDLEIVKMKNKYIAWQNIQWLPPFVFVLAFIISGCVAIYADCCKCFPHWGWLVITISIVLISISVVFGCFIVDRKINKYRKYINKFQESKEYKDQFNVYKKLKQSNIKKKIKQRVSNIIELYSVIDNQNLSKEEKINTLTKYYFDNIKIGG